MVTNAVASGPVYAGHSGTPAADAGSGNPDSRYRKVRKSKYTVQQAEVRGTVSDSLGTIQGMSVIIKGTTQGTTTNEQGRYSIQVPNKNAVLVFSMMGYQTQEIAVSGKTEINVVMSTISSALDEVVVVGFGSQKKVNLTGAVGVVDAKALESRPVTSATQALQGLVPGLKITTSTGALDQDMGISVRGTGTIGSSSGAPLILIDGMEGDLNTVNPQDIETISVLKDAAASSIYGSRAPFGVILVTTKSGKQGRISINYNNSFRSARPINMPEMMDSYTFAVMMNSALINSGRTARFSDETMQKMLDFQSGELTGGLDPRGDGTDAWQDVWAFGYANTDLYKETYKSNVLSQEHNLSATGGSEKMTYYTSFNYLDQGGLLNFGSDGMKRYNLTGKITSTLTDWLKFRYSARFTRTDNWRPTAFSGGFYNYFGRQNWPNIPVYDPNGYIFAPNIIGLELGGQRKMQTDQQYHQGAFILEPVKNWITNVELNYRIENGGVKQTTLPAYAHDAVGNVVNTKGTSSLYQDQIKENYLNLNVYSNYSRSFNDVHNFKIMGGFQLEELKQSFFSASKAGLVITDLTEFDLTTGLNGAGVAQPPAISGYSNEWATAAFFGRLNYDYDGRYLAEVNLRYDGTSRFRPGNQWQWNPSFSLGWNIANEHFWAPLKDVVNQLKPRFSYGQLGNQNTNNWYPTYRAMTLSPLSGGWLQNGIRPNTAAIGGLVSTVLTWEKVRSWNIGLDYGLFKNRLTGTFDYFTRYTDNMVGPAPELPATLGIATPQTNNTDLHTKGWEVSIGWSDRLANGLSYGVNLNLSDQITMIDSYPSNKTNSIDTYIGGYRDGLIWGYETVGLAKTQAEMDAHLASLPNGGQNSLSSQWGAGDIMYRDLNGDGKISAGSRTLGDHGDLTILGDSYSHYFFGVDLTAAWKGFDFRAFFQGVLKHDMWVGGNAAVNDEGGGGQFWGVRGNKSEWHMRGFKQHNDYFRAEPVGLPGHELPANLDAYFPRPLISPSSADISNGKNQMVQSRYIQDARYIRLKNIQLGYSLPNAWMQKIKFSNCRVFVSGENLFTFSPLFEVFDPETVSGGVGGNAYPLSSTLSFGISATF
ncbi:SusC/RagA family TonB-linked outer membrane protein [Olivibacter jilunii]|uniref:SusC/RagA family TonB-linked outer membrane protein n=1 Tax=Olivibacter jilunii TaxID=985016 RepID=UPI003F15270D